MTIRERLFSIGRKSNSEPAKIVEKQVKEKGILGGLVDIFTESLVSNTRISSKLLKANQGWVYRNNDVIAKEISTTEFELFTYRLVGDEVVFNPVVSHPILDLLDRFNEFTSSSDGLYITESHKNLAGNAYWYLEGKGMNVKNVYLLNPDKVTLDLGQPKYGQRIIKAYQYQDSVEGETLREDYDPEDIIHFKAPNPENAYLGKSKVEALAETIDTDNLAVEANKGLFKRGFINNFVLSTDKSLTPEQLKSLRAELKANYSGASNAFKAMILSGGLKPETIQSTNRDMQFIEQQKWLRDKIMSIFGNTPMSIGITEDVNLANAESGLLDWKRTTIKSEMKALTDTLNEFLVPRYGTNLILTFEDPVPEDRSQKVDEVVKLRNAKLITPNEGREILGFDAIKEDGADLLNYISQALVNVPEPVKNVDFKKVLRKSGMFATLQKKYEEKQIEHSARIVATKLVKSRRKKKVKQETNEAIREHEAFSNDQVWAFHNKQIRIVEKLEDIFRNKVEQFITNMVNQALAEVPNEINKSQHKALLDEEELLVKAQIDFTPILMEAGLLSGQQALNFIDVDEPYMGDNLRKRVAKNVKLFSESMVDTDRELLIDLIAKGTADGKSIPQIKTEIMNYFENYSKTQADRITRTEVIRVSNQAAVDAWATTDQVEAKQWLTAMDDRVEQRCAELNGKILGLKDIYEKNDYLDVREPPLHPNCRCTVLPVLVNQKNFDAQSYLKIKASQEKLQIVQKENKELKEKLEKLDKRTKEYKEVKAKQAEQELYIKTLESHLFNES